MTLMGHVDDKLMMQIVSHESNSQLVVRITLIMSLGFENSHDNQSIDVCNDESCV